MNTNTTLFISFFVVSLAIFLSLNQKEGFEAAGLVYNRPPEWFMKEKYDPNKWLVTYYPQQLSKPECMYKSRGNPNELNYLSSAYRFWRF